MTGGNDQRIEQLTELVGQLTDYIQVLINAVDELREEIGWGNRNARADGCLAGGRFRLTSMPLDPAAENWELNRVAPSTIEQLRRDSDDGAAVERSQGELF